MIKETIYEVYIGEAMALNHFQHMQNIC